MKGTPLGKGGHRSWTIETGLTAMDVRSLQGGSFGEGGQRRGNKFEGIHPDRQPQTLAGIHSRKKGVASKDSREQIKTLGRRRR